MPGQNQRGKTNETAMNLTDEHLPLTIRRAATLVPTLWKNGRGTTCELAVCPDGASLDDFTWRASMAEVATDGDFSFFPGVDRTIVLLGGAGMELELQPPAESPAHHALREPFAPFDFSGETSLTATLVDGPTHDFNFMVRREAGLGEVHVWKGPGDFPLPDDLVLLFIVRGIAELHGADATNLTPIALEPCDTVKFNGVVKQGLSVALPANAVSLAVKVTIHTP
jgi:environmental stress-induced protein Ves